MLKRNETQNQTLNSLNLRTHAVQEKFDKEDFGDEKSSYNLSVVFGTLWCFSVCFSVQYVGLFIINYLELFLPNT